MGWCGREFQKKFMLKGIHWNLGCRVLLFISTLPQLQQLTSFKHYALTLANILKRAVKFRTGYVCTAHSTKVNKVPRREGISSESSKRKKNGRKNKQKAQNMQLGNSG